ncbi:hypothetical protein DICPUDRAFT_98700 [Dictyostelium purpureum]|uniref:BRCT domain-containing protein n=1 Tax=Dictyostelium purpureum TaxID=5786 RepID=F0ZSS9_DICPU|nr:uncharacterized protein DICPUDRAFT_98700 [Dictyostelium purpureum]EGC33007.1 hypothetical protein DICPUDRAFT_98700 [Dictyostelium purpureum]|eukprot:XP_003290477.1 hypothetical protein DICPUDRAFT_98700 [Dictyostelium purpureum]
MDLDYSTIDHSNRAITIDNNIVNNNNINNNHNKIKNSQTSTSQPNHRPTSPKTVLSSSPSSSSSSSQPINKTRSSSQSSSFSPIVINSNSNNNNNNNNNNEDLSSSTEIHQDENQLNSNIFENLGFVIDITINLKRKMELVKIIKKNGGKSCYSCTKATHLITTKQGYIEKTQKVQQALSLGIPILVKEYVHYCAFKKELLPVETYLVSSLISNTSVLSLSQELEVKSNDEDHNGITNIENENGEVILTPLDISATTVTPASTPTPTLTTAIATATETIIDTPTPLLNNTSESFISKNTSQATTSDSNSLTNDSNLKSDHSTEDESKNNLSSIDSNTKTIESNYISTQNLSNTLASVDKVDLDDKQTTTNTTNTTTTTTTQPSQPPSILPTLSSSSTTTISSLPTNTVITPVSILKNPNSGSSTNNYKIDDAEENLKYELKEKKKKFSQKRNHLLNLKKSYQDPSTVTQSRPRRSSGGATLMEAITDQVNYISNLDGFKYYARGHQMNNNNTTNSIAITHNTNGYNNKSLRLNEYNPLEEEEEEFEELEEEFEDEEDEEYYDEDEEEEEEGLSDEYDEDEDNEGDEEEGLSDEDVSHNSKFKKQRKHNDFEFEHHHKQQKIQQLQKQIESLVLNNNGSQNVRKLRSYSRDYIDNTVVKGLNNEHNPTSRNTIQKSSSLDKILHSPKKRPIQQQQQQQQQDNLLNSNLLNRVKEDSITATSDLSSLASSSSSVSPSSPKQQSLIDKSNLLKNKKKKPFLPPLSTLVHILVTFIILSAFFMSLPNPTNNV